MFKNLAGLGNLMKMGTQVQGVKEKLKSTKVTGASGGGMVEVEMSGTGQVLRLVIEPKLVEDNEREMLEDLIPAAVNDAIAKAKQLHLEELKKLTEGIDFPGLDTALTSLID